MTILSSLDNLLLFQLVHAYGLSLVEKVENTHGLTNGLHPKVLISLLAVKEIKTTKLQIENINYTTLYVDDNFTDTQHNQCNL